MSGLIELVEYAELFLERVGGITDHTIEVYVFFNYREYIAYVRHYTLQLKPVPLGRYIYLQYLQAYMEVGPTPFNLVRVHASGPITRYPKVYPVTCHPTPTPGTR